MTDTPLDEQRPGVGREAASTPHDGKSREAASTPHHETSREAASTPHHETSRETASTPHDETSHEATSLAPRPSIPEPEEPQDDSFAKFSPAPDETPSRVKRARRRMVHVLTHEWTLAAVGALVLAAIMTWPTLQYPGYQIPQDIGDPLLQAWQVAWSGHALLTDPSQLWNSNSFYPEQYSFAFSDTLLGYAPAGMIGVGPEAALIRYNILYVLLHALAFFGAYVLVRQLGSGKTGAVVAGLAFAYAPWRLDQNGHMHVISTGGIALALAMIARGHGFSLRHGFRPERTKPWWAFAGWLVAAWQISLGFGIGLAFGYVLAGITVISGLVLLVKRFMGDRRVFGWKLLIADGVGGLLFAATAGLMALPYLKVVDLHPYARRGEDYVSIFSPPLQGFFTSPPQSMLWGESHETARQSLAYAGEMSLLPGFVLYGLAAAGLIMSVWTLRQRILLGIGVAVSIILAMGTEFFGGRPGYLTLYDILPGWDAIRTPGRLVIWTTLLLGLLAAGAITALTEQAKQVSADRVTTRPHPLLRLATLIPVVLVLAEGLNTTAHPNVDPAPPSLAHVKGPMLVLPSEPIGDMAIMLWSTYNFEPMVNGNSGFYPQKQTEIRDHARNFPDPATIAELRALGVRTVVVLKKQVKGTEYEQALTAPVEGLGIQREERDDAIIFTL